MEFFDYAILCALGVILLVGLGMLVRDGITDILPDKTKPGEVDRDTGFIVPSEDKAKQKRTGCCGPH